MSGQWGTDPLTGNPFCLVCGCHGYVLVDGREMTHDQIVRLPRAPYAIETRLVHDIRCESEHHRMQLGLHVAAPPVEGNKG